MEFTTILYFNSRISSLLSKCNRKYKFFDAKSPFVYSFIKIDTLQYLN